MSKLIWLASYPKSGNTWLRIVLANYLRCCTELIAINALDDFTASGRTLFDEVMGVEAADLTNEPIDKTINEKGITTNGNNFSNPNHPSSTKSRHFGGSAGRRNRDDEFEPQQLLWAR